MGVLLQGLFCGTKYRKGEKIRGSGSSVLILIWPYIIMKKWISELQTDNLEIRFRVSNYVYEEKSAYQKIVVVDTLEYGRMLLLDDKVMTTTKDEFIYHEMITHIPLFSHPDPRKVAVIGGGDGGAVREILKHDTVEKVILCEIDEAVVKVARKYFPDISCGLDDQRVEVICTDGIKYLQDINDTFDIIIIDSTDPVGPAEGLFAKKFYESVFTALTKNGIFVAQTESPFVFGRTMHSAFNSISQTFPIANLYLAVIPTYPGCLWSFTIGSRNYEVTSPVLRKLPVFFPTNYYTPEVHEAAFILPKFVKEIIEKP